MDRTGVLSRLRFSLRTCLTVTFLVAVYFTCLLRQDASRRQLISDIEGVGGTVKFDESISRSLFKSQTVTEITIPRRRIANVGLLRLKSFSNLSTLGLKDVDFTTKDGSQFRCSEFQFTKINDSVWKNLESIW